MQTYPSLYLGEEIDFSTLPPLTGELPYELWDIVLRYLGVDSLRHCLQACKGLHVLGTRDRYWYPHLHNLLKEKDAIGSTATKSPRSIDRDIDSDSDSDSDSDGDSNPEWLHLDGIRIHQGRNHWFEFMAGDSVATTRIPLYSVYRALIAIKEQGYVMRDDGKEGNYSGWSYGCKFMCATSLTLTGVVAHPIRGAQVHLSGGAQGNEYVEVEAKRPSALSLRYQQGGNYPPAFERAYTDMEAEDFILPWMSLGLQDGSCFPSDAFWTMHTRESSEGSIATTPTTSAPGTGPGWSLSKVREKDSNIFDYIHPVLWFGAERTGDDLLGLLGSGNKASLLEGNPSVYEAHTQGRGIFLLGSLCQRLCFSPYSVDWYLECAYLPESSDTSYGPPELGSVLSRWLWLLPHIGAPVLEEILEYLRSRDIPAGDRCNSASVQEEMDRLASLWFLGWNVAGVTSRDDRPAHPNLPPCLLIDTLAGVAYPIECSISASNQTFHALTVMWENMISFDSLAQRTEIDWSAVFDGRYDESHLSEVDMPGELERVLGGILANGNDRGPDDVSDTSKGIIKHCEIGATFTSSRPRPIPVMGPEPFYDFVEELYAYMVSNLPPELDRSQWLSSSSQSLYKDLSLDPLNPVKRAFVVALELGVFRRSCFHWYPNLKLDDVLARPKPATKPE